MEIYHYDPKTLEFLGKTFARKDPLEEGRYLIPANATGITPPQLGPNETCVFNKSNNSWSKVADYRGQDYYDSSGKKYAVKKLGETLPEWSIMDPPPEGVNFVYENGAWIKDPEKIKEEIRDQRDSLLKQSDWTQLPDAPVDQSAWATYRQALRDVPQQSGFPDNVTWPEEPK